MDPQINTRQLEKNLVCWGPSRPDATQGNRILDKCRLRWEVSNAKRMKCPAWVSAQKFSLTVYQSFDNRKGANSKTT